MSVTVVPYDPSWPQKFQEIKSQLNTYLLNVPILSIEHIGSTSVPGLAAKPVIDIDINVARENVQSAIDELVRRGKFEYLGELGIEDRHAMRSPDQSPPRNIYVCVDGAFQTRNHLGLRDTLRKNSKLREEYGRVKTELANRPGGITVVEYVEGKSDVVKKILREAGLLSEKELCEIEDANKKNGRIGAVNTERLVLREFVLGDIAVYWHLESQEEVVRYQNHGPQKKAQARRHVVDIVRNSFLTPRMHTELAVTFEGQFIGRVGAKIRPFEKESETQQDETRHLDLWYAFEPVWQGKGFATEAMKAFIPLLGSQLRLEIECDPRNTSSVKMAKRLGFDLTGSVERAYECKGEWVGSLVFQKVV